MYYATPHSILMTSNKLEHYHFYLAKFLKMCRSKAQLEILLIVNVFFKKKLQRETKQWDFYWINNLCPTLAVVKFLRWKSLCSLNKGWSTVLHGQDTDVQGTSSAHEPQTFNESLLYLPLTLPRMQCVLESRNLWGHMLWVSLWPHSPTQLSLWK